MLITIHRYFHFEGRHAVEITEEVGSLYPRRVDAFVAEFTEETAITHVGTQVDLPEVLDAVVGGDAVNMVDGHTGFDGCYPCDINGVRDEDVFFVTKRMIEHEILRFVALSIPWYLARIHLFMPAVRIDAHANYAAVTVVDIERDAGVRVRAHVLYEDIVE